MTWLLEARGLRKVTAGTLGCNTPMLRLMHGSGMQPDGVRRGQEIVDGAAQDILYFARFGDA
jgi:RimJ/RimL family protein N-acetyltransferase